MSESILLHMPLAGRQLRWAVADGMPFLVREDVEALVTSLAGMVPEWAPRADELAVGVIAHSLQRDFIVEGDTLPAVHPMTAMAFLLVLSATADVDADVKAQADDAWRTILCQMWNVGPAAGASPGEIMRALAHSPDLLGHTAARFPLLLSVLEHADPDLLTKMRAAAGRLEAALERWDLPAAVKAAMKYEEREAEAIRCYGAMLPETPSAAMH